MEREQLGGVVSVKVIWFKERDKKIILSAVLYKIKNRGARTVWR